MIDKLSWIAVYPEIVLLVMTCVIILADVSVKSAGRTLTYYLTLATLAGVAGMQAVYALNGYTMYAFSNLLVSDSMGNWLKCFAAMAMFVTMVYARPYSQDRDMLRRGGELFILSLLSLLGIFVMISGNNFLIIYLGLELLTLSSYALVALRRDNANAVEASMKYFILGAMASGFLLYGMSMLYGATGTLMINEVQQVVASGMAKQQILVLGVVFVVAGLAFKLGAVPFHMWMPDVYEGAPTSVALIVAGAPKLAAFAIMVRLLVEGLLPMAFHWQQMLVVLAIASLLVGNLAAIMQKNLKRMLAYSTISQVGFVLLAFVAGFVNNSFNNVVDAYSAGMFYIITYVLTTLVNFGVIMLLAREGFECDNINDLAGLNQRSPLYAGVMAISLLSLAGIPPMVGFYAKLTVLQALIASGQAFHIGLAVFAVVMSLIGAFYYLRVIKVMYFDAPNPQLPAKMHANFEVRSVLSLNGALVLVLGLLPAGLMNLCAHAIYRMLSA